MRKYFILLFVLAAAGCAIVNPYENDFSCPDTFHGKCISVHGAYADSLTGKDDAYEKKINNCIGGNCPEAGGGDPVPTPAGTVEDRNYNAYRSALYSRYDQLLRDPQTPVVAPPKVMRVLFLPYKGQEGEFYMYRHVYFFTEEPKWILGDSVEAYDD
jgi:conjugal transfer pilus assembly protein TraV